MYVPESGGGHPEKIFRTRKSADEYLFEKNKEFFIEEFAGGDYDLNNSFGCYRTKFLDDIRPGLADIYDRMGTIDFKSFTDAEFRTFFPYVKNYLPYYIVEIK